MKKCLHLFIVFITLAFSSTAFAQYNDLLEQRAEDRLQAEQQGEVKTTAQELVEMLKQRALRKVAEERRKQLWNFRGLIGLHTVNDNNVNADSVRLGDYLFRAVFFL